MDFSSGGVDGPSVGEIRDYTIVTREMVDDGDYEEDDLHPAERELREWGRDIAARKTEKTARRYYRAIKSLVCWLDYYRGIQRPSEATEDDVTDYLKWLMATEWSVNTREGRFNACQQFYQHAYDEGWIDEDIASGLTLRDYNLDVGNIEESRGGFGVDEHKWIERENVFRLWDRENITSPAARDSLIFKLMWYTTCRPEAITTMQLEPEDSPGSGPTWHDREEGWFRVANLKRGSSPDAYRKVYYPPDRLNPAIDEWLRIRDCLGPHGDSEKLFITHQKPEMRASHISRKVKQAARNAGIQEVAGYDVHGNERWAVTAKTIRHSAITWLCNKAGISPVIVQNQAGHNNLETTMSYVHDDEQSRRAALNSVW